MPTPAQHAWIEKTFGVSISPGTQAAGSPGGAAEEDQSVDTTASQENQSIDPDAGQANQSIAPDAGQPNQSIDPNAGQPNQSVDQDAGQLIQAIESESQPSPSVDPSVVAVASVVTPMTPGPPAVTHPATGDPSIYELPKIPEPFSKGPVGNPEEVTDAAELAQEAPEADALLEGGGELAAEEGAELAGAAAVEGAIPIVGWILLGATVAYVGYRLYKAYVITHDGKPVRPATPEEEREATENKNKPVPTAQDSDTGQPLYTPADGDYSPAIDPVTGEPFKAPSTTDNSEPLQASSDLDRHDHENYAEGVLQRGTAASCEELAEAISGLIEALRERALQMEDPKNKDPKVYKGHKQRYLQTRDLLKKLVEQADSREDCSINTGEAKDWINTDPPPQQ
jgi:hypothetical protein